MKIDAIIHADMNDKEFPLKLPSVIKGKRVLERTIHRVRAVNLLEENMINSIIVCLPKLAINNNLENWLKNNFDNITLYRGSNSDILKRYYDAAMDNNVENILNVYGYNPLICPVMLYGLIKAYENNENKQYHYLNIVSGWEAEILPLELLQQSYECSNEEEKKVLGSWIMKNTICHKIGTNDMDLKDINLSVQTKADFDKIKEYHEYL